MAPNKVQEPAGMDSETLDLLTASLRELFAQSADARAVSAALAELGWDEVRQSDPSAATRLLFSEQGRAVANSRVLDEVTLDELAEVLPPSDAVRAVVYPVARHGDPAVAAVLLGPIEGVDELVLPRSTPDGMGILTIPAESVRETVRPAAGFDPRSGWLVLPALPGAQDGTLIAADDAWTRAQAAAHRALASEIAAVCEAALAKATEHAAAREQFGKRIATFQAVRHRLAEAYVEICAIHTAIDSAWTAASSEIGPVAARLAKLRAGRAQVMVFRHVLQVFGALGLTAEGPVHQYVTRAAALDALLGDHAEQAELLGEALLSGAPPHPVAEV